MSSKTSARLISCITVFIIALSLGFYFPDYIKDSGSNEKCYKIFLHTYTIVLGIGENLLVHYADLLSLMFCLTLWAPSIQFSKLINQNNIKSFDFSGDQTRSKIKAYQELKKLSGLVNEALHWLMISYTLDALFFNSTNLMDVLVGNWFYRIKRIYSLSNVVLVFYFAADTARQVRIS